jgi:crotonobetainyl-CoA:carnitine CoA-transferase CaiB-like acyl-CoA transferase
MTVSWSPIVAESTPHARYAAPNHGRGALSLQATRREDAPLSPALPLAGIRVLTLENFGAGPYGSLYLADLGAEVVKVENRDQGGDATRGMGPFFLGEHDSHFFQTFNLNKKSMTLNLKLAEGQQAFHRLVRTADVVMNNLRGDQPARLGLDYATLGAVNPRVVCAHLSAYGRDNERRGWPGYDYLMQAEAGYLHLTGEPGTPPARMGLSIVDYMTGVTTAVAVLSSLIGVMKTGRGCDVDVSLFDVALHQLTYPGNWYLNEGHRTERMPRSSHPSAVPVQLFRTGDGWIFVMCMTGKFWQALVEQVGRADLASDPRFATPTDRRRNRDELTRVLDQEFSRATTRQWLDRLQGLLPAAPVYDLPQALDNPYAHSVGMVRSLPHPQRPDFRVLSNPIKLDGQRLPARPAPALGEHTDELLREIGYSDSEIAALHECGAA